MHLPYIHMLVGLLTRFKANNNNLSLNHFMASIFPEKNKKSSRFVIPWKSKKSSGFVIPWKSKLWFCDSLKKSEKLWFSDVSRGIERDQWYEMGWKHYVFTMNIQFSCLVSFFNSLLFEIVTQRHTIVNLRFIFQRK